MEKPVTTFDRIRKISPKLKSLDKIPLTGNSPPFPWEELSLGIARTFERDGAIVRLEETSWRSGDELYEGIASPVFSSAFSVPSLEGTLHFVMPVQEVEFLAFLFLTKDTRPTIALREHALLEAFYRFFVVEALYEFRRVFQDKSIVPVLTDDTSPPSGDALCLDLSLSLKDRVVHGRLMLSPEFRNAWAEHFIYSDIPERSSARAAEAELRLEVGKIVLTSAEWRAIREGDFIIPDICSLDPRTLEGPLLLTAEGRPLFRAELSGGHIKILERPLFHEVQIPMAKKKNNEKEEDDLSDFDLNDDLEEFEENDSLFDDIETEEFDEKGSEKRSEEEGIETEDSDRETENVTERIVEEASLHPEGDKKNAVESEARVFSRNVPDLQPIPVDRVPLVLTAEVGRIRMTLEELLKLEPGNLFELNVDPKNGVDLTVNGISVGKAELIRIGEVLGIRILQLGGS